MHYSLIIMSTKSGLFSKKYWIMQYPSVFQKGKGRLDKKIMVEMRPGRKSKKCGISIRIQRTVILSTAMRWTEIMQQMLCGVQKKVGSGSLLPLCKEIDKDQGFNWYLDQ